MILKSYTELKNLKEQKKLEKYNRKQEHKALKIEMKKEVIKKYNSTCSICSSTENLKVKRISKGKFVSKNAILLCKSCRKERKQNPMNFYWKLIKKNPSILKNFIKE